MNKLRVTLEGRVFTLDIQEQPNAPGRYIARVDGQDLKIILPHAGSAEALNWMIIDGRSHELAFDPEARWVYTNRGRYAVEIREEGQSGIRTASGDGRIKAPIPGIITRLLVKPGDQVSVGQPLLGLEAMKMENEIRAPKSGTVSQIAVAAGKTVILGELLIEIE